MQERNFKTNHKMCDMADVLTNKAKETTVFVKNCMKNLNSVVALASANCKNTKATSNNLKISGEY